MKYAIQATGNHKLAIYQRVLSILPPMIRLEIEAALSSYDGRRLCEIHLHKDAPVMLTLDGENVLCDYHCTKDDISEAFPIYRSGESCQNIQYQYFNVQFFSDKTKLFHTQLPLMFFITIIISNFT